MRQIVRLFVIALASVAHAWAFLMAWSWLGSEVLFSSGASTGSYVLAVLSASITTSAIATAPFGLLVGALGRRQLLAPSILLLLTGWLTLCFVMGEPNRLSLAAELVAIALTGTACYLLGSTMRAGRAA